MKKISKSLIKKSSSWSPSLCSGNSVDSNSWFTIKEKIGREISNPDKVIKTDNIRCKMIQLNPNLKQRNTLLTWFELSRLTYNLTINLLRKDNKISKLKMRDRVKQEMRNNRHLYALQKNSGVYQQSIDFSVFDVFKARKSAISNLKAKNIKYFRLRYKKKSHHIKTMCINPKNAVNAEGTGFKKKGLEDLSPSEKIISTKDTRLGYNARTKKFTMYIPYDKKCEETVNRNSICALDPGIRTFQTLYSPSGVSYQFGDENNILKKNMDRIDSVKAFKDEPWYKKYVNRLKTKLKNRIDDIHWKTSSFICKNFDTILIGNMSTKGVVKKGSTINKSTKRTCYALSHFLFKERLKSKASEYNCVVKIVDESYTSKTCGRCGEINENLGGSKIFKCPEYMCFYRMDRDIHGARNIYIKNS